MKSKLSVLALGVTMVLMVSACGANAVEPEKPVTPVQTVQTEQTVQNVQTEEAVKSEAEPAEDNSKLYIAYRATYDCCVSYTSESLEDQLNKEVRDLKSVAAGFVSLPDDYAEDYKAWRIENCGTGFKEAEATESDGATIPEYGFTAVDETLYTTGTVNLRSGPGTSYDKVGSLSVGAEVHRVGIGTGTADGWSQIELSDGTLVCVSSNYLSFTKPAAQQLSSNQVNANSGESQQVSSDGRSSFLDPSPNAGKTEEQIQQELEDAQNTEFRIHGTGGSTGEAQQPSGDTWGFNPREGLTEEEIQQILEEGQNTEFRINGT